MKTGDTTDLMQGLERLEPLFENEFLEKLAIRIESDIKEEITAQGLVDTGRFRTSIHGRKVNKNQILISDGVVYGLFHEFGTGIHGPKARFIRPKKAEALRFEVNKKIMYARKVQGVPAKRPFYKGLGRTSSVIERTINDTFNKIFK